MEVRIIVLLSAIMPIIFGVLLTVYWHSRKTYRGFGFWVLSDFCIGFGFILLGFRGRIPDFFSISVGNALLVYSLVLIYDGVLRFFDRRSFDLWGHALFGIYILLQAYLTYWQPNANARILLTSAASILIELGVAAALFRYAPINLRRICRTIAIIFVLLALAEVLRGVYVLSQPQQINFLSDPATIVSSFAFTCSITIWTFYLFFLNSARLELDVEEYRRNLITMTSTVQRKMAQLALLEEVSKMAAKSLDERKILQYTVDALIDRFGYAEAAISLLVDGNQLEVTTINGTEDFGYQPGFRQQIGEGIIGYAAEQQRAYICTDIEHDPHYFTIGRRSGSAVGVPMLIEGKLLGVLYVETNSLNAFDQEYVQILHTLLGHVGTAIQKARLYAQVQEHLRALIMMQSVSETILSTLDIQQIFQSVVQLLKDTFDYKYISIYTINGQTLRFGAQVGYPPDLIYETIPITNGVTGRTIQTQKTQFIQDVSKDPDFLRVSPEIESEICVPLLKEGKAIGILNVEAAPGHLLTQGDVEVLTALAGSVAIATENARLHSEVQKLALTDALTNLPNRRAFDSILENEVARAARYEYPLSLIIIDMDSFKEFNDRWGHPAGDERLKAAAKLLRNGVRSPDTAARYGGEEFALILPYTTMANAFVLAERLRIAAEKFALQKSDDGAPISGYTFSMGIATLPDNGKTKEELLHAADQAELDAKKRGKNRVCLADN